MNNLALKNVNVATTPIAQVNVVGIFVDRPANQIEKFILRDKAKNTIKTYWNHFNHMFMYTCGKNINDLTWGDVQSINIEKVKDYRDFMINSGSFAASTVNQRTLACKALWDDFFESEKVSKNVFALKKLKQKKNSWDSLTDKEIHLLYDFCLNENQKSETKKLYFEFLYTTGLRKNIAQTIKLDEIKRKKDMKTQQEYWVIEVEDKDKPREVAIVDEFYNRLVANYKKEGFLDGKIFHVNNATIDSVLERFCKKYGITRSIVQHSIKGSGGDMVQSVFGDIMKTAEYLGHENIQTSFNNYLGKNKSYSEQASILMQGEYDVNMLKGLGEDVLIGLIEKYTEKHGRDIIIKLCVELDKMSR